MSVATAPFTVRRLGTLMRPDAGDPREAWGVLNPASARDRDGVLWLFPRVVAEGNYSRIARARVLHDDDGTPVGVERAGLALEPEEAFERNVRTAGVEDPRITFVPVLDQYVMAYAGYGPLGPRIALAVSDDLVSWRRLGPLQFAYDPALGTDLNLYPNKDAYLFPEPVTGPDGEPALAIAHRPMWDLGWIVPAEGDVLPRTVTDARPGIWTSFIALADVQSDIRRLAVVRDHRQVALPGAPWEAVKIGGGTPPVRVREGWLTLYHGVEGSLVKGLDLQPDVIYAAGLMVLDADDATTVLYRSPVPVLAPELGEERQGMVDNVVFPTAIEAVPGREDAFHVFYGMADARIGVALLERA